MDHAWWQVLSTVLLWNFGWTGQLHKLRDKVERDFVPTTINGKQDACTCYVPFSAKPAAIDRPLVASGCCGACSSSS